MKLHQQIDDHLSKAENTLLNLSLLTSDLSYLSNCEGNREFKILESYRFFIRIWHGLYLYTILELFKLTDKDEQYSLIKLLNTLRNRYKSITWNNPMLIDDIERIQSELQNIGNLSISTKLKTIRDESIAHMDKVRSDISLQLIEIIKLYDVCCDSFNEIQYCLKGSTNTFEFSGIDKGHSLITHLANYKEIEALVYKNHSCLEQNTRTEEMLKIIRKK